jgi:hypothetical protein
VKSRTILPEIESFCRAEFAVRKNSFPKNQQTQITQDLQGGKIK